MEFKQNLVMKLKLVSLKHHPSIGDARFPNVKVGMHLHPVQGFFEDLADLECQALWMDDEPALKTLILRQKTQSNERKAFVKVRMEMNYEPDSYSSYLAEGKYS